jgi:nucleoside diphosphate kinase
MPVKASLYEREIYFREGLAAAQDTLGGELSDVLRNSALLMLKPDGVLTARLGPVLSFLEAHGFAVVAAQSVAFTPLLWREMWRYQLTSATLDRLAVNEHVYSSSPALLLLLREEGPSAVPATVRLSGLKGSSDPAARSADSLRSRLGHANRILSHIHVADEPADLVRELGLLLDPRARRRLLAALGTGQLSAADRDLLQTTLKRDAEGGWSLDPAPPLARVEDAVRSSRAGSAGSSGGGGSAEDSAAAARELADRVLGYLDGIRAGETIPWRSFINGLDALNLQFTDWDLAVLGSVSVPADEPGAVKVIGNPEPGIWENDAPQLA